MGRLTRDEEIALGIVPPPPGVEELDPETKVKRIPRRGKLGRTRINLNAADKLRVKEDLKRIYGDWNNNTSLLRNRLRRTIELMESVKGEKTFPWKNSCNLHIPLIEIHIAILHAAVASTMLDNDPIWFVRTMLPNRAGADEVDPKLEVFLNWVGRAQGKFDIPLSTIYYNAFRDPLAIGVMDWVEEMEKRFDIRSYATVEQLLAEFPDAASAGVSDTAYQGMLDDLMAGEQVDLTVEEKVVKYRGPKLREVELKDLVLSPATAPSFEYAEFVGDKFMQRLSYFKKGVTYDWFDKEEVKLLSDSSAVTVAIDSISQSQDRIEGLGRSRQKSDEYVGIQGVYKADLDDDGEDELYMVVYAPDSGALLRFERFPYIHNRCNYIPFRIKRKSNRLLGDCIPWMLGDLNDEVDTQHQQRIDSRTITTVPSFKRLETSTIDFGRKDQKFYPGVTFQVRAMNEVEQFKITQTDLGTSMQEENTLFMLAEQRDGASMLRSGGQTPGDPRAPAKKVQMLLGQSNVRVDDYMKELSIGTNEVAAQSLELYYQFAPETIQFPDWDEATSSWLMAEIQRVKLRNNNMTIRVSRTSVSENSENQAQKKLVEYQILSKEPLIGQNLQRRHELVRDLCIALRRKDVNKLIPPLQQLMQEVGGQPGGDPMMNPMQQLMQNIMGQNRRDSPEGTRQGGPDISTGSYGGEA